VLDSALVWVALGSVLWALLPHPAVEQVGWAPLVNQVVVVSALTATVVPLARLLRRPRAPQATVVWLLIGLDLAMAEQLLPGFSKEGAVGRHGTGLLFLLALATTGQFALSSRVRLLPVAPAPESRRFSRFRLFMLSLGIDTLPILLGLNAAFGTPANPWLLALLGLVISGLVISRVRVLATERERAEQALNYQASHDPLTGLPNRHLLIGGLRDALARGGDCALLFCDLDDFKGINDRYGHDVGDAVLVETGQRLQRSVRPPDLVSRIGGDEFVVLLVDESARDSDAVQERMQDALAQPAPRPDAVGISASIGIVAADATRDPEQLLKAADHKMYEQKIARGRGRPPSSG
jgi:diguanylate cyclase (GGDEF)-like protein